MKESFVVGVVLGLLAGAALVAYRGQIGKAVDKGKQVVKKQMEKI